ncbi:MAG TPA: hypothetical protein VIP11_02945 [Gemmatimonadaceae bacterium]
MKSLSRLTRLLALVACLVGARPIDAQTPPPQSATVRVFLDCPRCDEEFVRTEITYVNWVRDRTAADVHILVTNEPTGGGGNQYTLAFLGLRGYAGKGDTLSYFEETSATPDETRKGLTRVLKVGLVRFLLNTSVVTRLDVTVADAPAGANRPSGQTVRDPWHFWVFTVGFNGFANGDQNNRFNNLNGNFNASRTTQGWKVQLSVNENYNQSDFTIDDTTSTFIRRSYNFSQLAVRSLGPRLSAGYTGSVGSSTFQNKQFSVSIAPAVEFDIFPYSESTRRMLTLQYSAGVESFKYRTVTVYGRLQESHPTHSLALSLLQNQPWGSARIGVNGGQYLDMTNRNYASVSVGTNLRLFKGLNLNVDGNYSALRNQVYLPRVDATEQEILLQQRQLATGYEYFVFLGLNYTFGSVLNNVVNPRFGRDGCC